MVRKIAKLIGRLKLPALLIFAAGMHVFASTHAQSQEKAKALLRLNYVATGGDQWKALAQAELTGDVNLAGATGTFHAVIDLKSGRDATTVDAGPVHLEQINLPDSSWQRDLSGVVTYADTPDARKDAINESFIDRNGWWFIVTSTEDEHLGVRHDRDRSYQLVRVVPSGGRSMTLVMVISHQGQQRDVTFSVEELLPAGGRMGPLGGPPLSEAMPEDLDGVGVSPSRFSRGDL
jgi:hypothetical protein